MKLNTNDEILDCIKKEKSNIQQCNFGKKHDTKWISCEINKESGKMGICSISDLNSKNNDKDYCTITPTITKCDIDYIKENKSHPIFINNNNYYFDTHSMLFKSENNTYMKCSADEIKNVIPLWSLIIIIYSKIISEYTINDIRNKN